ncbi:MAG TPA: heavy metal translocating P-type ATPase, partial [Actinomycetales bacterium]|nr:heavy metal translocating P-type ATPase [Actinomycetales bacterium]
AVLSGAVNGEDSLVIEASAAAADSRYAQIVNVLTEAETRRPPIRRLADRLGGWYTALSLAIGIAGWLISGDPQRFLAVVVIATPCPLLIGVPVAIIGAISLSAKRGIIVKNPEMLEQISTTRTVIFDKTGTLTYGRPTLTESFLAPGLSEDSVLALAAGAERYSRHPLAAAIVDGATHRGLEVPEVESVSERPGEGLDAQVAGRRVQITNLRGAIEIDGDAAKYAPAEQSGLECVVLIDGTYAATLRFRDQPRGGAADFVAHLPGRHGVDRTMLVSGDRESEVRYVADQVGIPEVHVGISPEGKLEIVREVTAEARTLFLGDGINDAPAMTAATVGVAFGAAHDVTSEAADAVVLDSSLERLDDLIHIGERMRRIALQSALGGIGISLVGMGFAVFGLITPIVGAILQEVIDLAAILNSARVAIDKGSMADFHPDEATPAS